MGHRLKLGLNLGYWAGGPPGDAWAAVAGAERLGFDSVWTEAAARMPSQLIQKMALLGRVEKIRDDLAAWEQSFVDILMINGDPPTLRRAAQIVLG